MGLNVTEIPANVIAPSNGQHSKIHYLYIKSHENFTIKSSDFQNFVISLNVFSRIRYT